MDLSQADLIAEIERLKLVEIKYIALNQRYEALDAENDGLRDENDEYKAYGRAQEEKVEVLEEEVETLKSSNAELEEECDDAYAQVRVLQIALQLKHNETESAEVTDKVATLSVGNDVTIREHGQRQKEAPAVRICIHWMEKGRCWNGGEGSTKCKFGMHPPRKGNFVKSQVEKVERMDMSMG
jgi:predicted nuclease with TOPRIM domain